MTLESLYKKTFTLLLLFSSFQIMGQFSLEKTLIDSMEVDEDAHLLVENKYGNVEVTGWDKNTVKIDFWIEVKKDDISDAENLINRIKPSISNYGNYIVAKTEIEKSGNGFFKQMIADLNLENNESGIEMQVKIFMPKKMDLDVSNEFGDVILLDWSGKLKCKLKHGDLIASSKIESIDLDQNYGKINLDDVNSVELDVRNVVFKAGQIEKLQIESHGSDFEIKEVNNLSLKSDKDEFKIGKVNSFKGNINYGSARFDTISKGITVKLKVSDLQISKITKSDPSIFIEQQNSDIDINVKDIAFKLHATLEEGTFRVPNEINNINKEVLDEKDNQRVVTGEFGTDNFGSLTIEGKKGFVVLREL